MFTKHCRMASGICRFLCWDKIVNRITVGGKYDNTSNTKTLKSQTNRKLLKTAVRLCNSQNSCL